jgi:hypothetical protein
LIGYSANTAFIRFCQHLRNSRKGICERLLDLQIEIAPALALIDELKEQLRAIAQEDDEGFIEQIAGKGIVEAKAGRARELKGVLPELVPQAFLAYPKLVSRS